MVNWKVTATTIYCDAVDEDVTLMVYKDATAKCVAYNNKYSKPGKEISKLLEKRGQKLGRKLRCEGPDCPRVTGYRDKLFAEESAGKNQG